MWEYVCVWGGGDVLGRMWACMWVDVALQQWWLPCISLYPASVQPSIAYNKLCGPCV